MELRIKKLHPEAIIPTRAKPGDSGLDLYANLEDSMTLLTIPPYSRCKVHTGIAVQLPAGYEGQVRGRSGLSAKGIVACGGIGTIDNGYRGEIGVVLLNCSREQFVVRHGDRIAQLVVSPVVYPSVVVVDELDQTERGEAGFGSTGV